MAEHLHGVESAEDSRDAKWRRIYISVIVFTAVVITGLWLFSYYFSR